MRGDDEELPGPRRAGTRLHARFKSADDDDARVPSPERLHQRIKVRRVRRVQADAAMRGRAAEALDIGGGVHGVAAVEEHRMRHRRIVVFLGIPHRRQARRPERAGRRDVAAPCRRDLPLVGRPAVDRHGHALRRDIDLRQQLACPGTLGADEECRRSSRGRCEIDHSLQQGLHSTLRPLCA